MYRYANNLEDVDWEDLKTRLIADDFHNGRTTAQLRDSFRNSQHVVMVWTDQPSAAVIGTARALSDGVGNSYVIDVWTETPHREQGIATTMMKMLIAAVPGQHIYLQTDDAIEFYRKLGFADQPAGMSLVSGSYLQNSTKR